MDDVLQAIVNQKMGGPQPGAAQQQQQQQPGVDPAAAAQAAQAAQAQAAAQAKDLAAKTPTEGERAAAKVAPNQPGSQDPIELIDIGEGDNMRQLTKQQIGSTLDRYRDLNHKWANDVKPMEPIMEVAKQIITNAKGRGYDAKPEEVAQFMQAAVRAFLQNPQMGGDGKKSGSPDGEGAAAKPAMSPPGGDGDGDEALSSWERENAVKLPPGYKEGMAMNKQLAAQMGQILQLLQGARGPAAQAQAATENAQQQAAAAQTSVAASAKQAIMNNIGTAFQRAGLNPEADMQDFQAFAMSRGYSPDDFIDPGMTATVAADFKANRDAPEIARLREIAQKRSAFTGSLQAAPGGAAAAPGAPADPMLAQLLTQAMGQRNMR